jgi:hypothetical protein
VTPSTFLRTILDPGLAWCAAIPGWTIPADDRARVLLLAIAGQEANWTWRLQDGGPARGFWQFEKGGGVTGVLNDQASRNGAVLGCGAAHIPANAVAAYRALALNDNLAVAFARLLLWSDPEPLPGLTAQDKCWDYYLRNWRPGKPRPGDWPGNYQSAMDALAA